MRGRRCSPAVPRRPADELDTRPRGPRVGEHPIARDHSRPPRRLANVGEMTTPDITLNSGTTIPQLGLGVWQATNDETEHAVRYAIDEAGYRHIDTAAAYGNEEGVGRALAASSVPREDIFVTTKLWNADQGYEPALKAFDTSLKKLGTEYVDLYLIHWPLQDRERILRTWDALEKIA